MIAGCDKEAEGVGEISLPGNREPVKIDRCYRGRDHLQCVVSALRNEAELLDRGIVEENYADRKDMASVCRIDPARLDGQIEISKTFDVRAEVLNTEYARSADCTDHIQEDIRKVKFQRAHLGIRDDDRSSTRSMPTSTACPTTRKRCLLCATRSRSRARRWR